MTSFIRYFAGLAIASALTWWLLFFAPAPDFTSAATPAPAATPVTVEVVQAVNAPPVELRPLPEQQSPTRNEPPSDAPVDSSRPAAESEPLEPESAAVNEVGPQSAPPPEAGVHEGELEGTALDEVEQPQEVDERAVASVEELATDKSLLEVAEEELSGTAKLGFATVFVSAAEDQLEIARAFGEDVVLVPRAALDGKATASSSFRLDLSKTAAPVLRLVGRPPLERYRQYRDLFAYEFGRLPKPIRELRTSVVRRDQVYLFAALIPPSEWAVVVGRRRQALFALGVDESDVARFVMRYARRDSGGFDIAVESITLTNGETVYNRPAPSPRVDRASHR